MSAKLAGADPDHDVRLHVNECPLTPKLVAGFYLKIAPGGANIVPFMRSVRNLKAVVRHSNLSIC